MPINTPTDKLTEALSLIERSNKLQDEYQSLKSQAQSKQTQAHEVSRSAAARLMPFSEGSLIQYRARVGYGTHNAKYETRHGFVHFMNAYLDDSGAILVRVNLSRVAKGVTLEQIEKSRGLLGNIEAFSFLIKTSEEEMEVTSNYSLEGPGRNYEFIKVIETPR